MNPQNQVRGIIFGVGFICAGIGYATGVLVTDSRLRKEYEESARSYRRAMELTEVKGEAPEITEEALIDVDTIVYNDIKVFNPDVVDHKPLITNPYHTAVNAFETPVQQFVNGEVNAYGISYIEDEEFLEDDGRAKYSVTIVMDAHNPTFFMNGEMLEDWDTRLGASIVKDFLDRVPPGINPVLYVRNHKTEEDYELTPEHP